MTKRGVDEETGEFLGPSRGEERRAALAVLELAARMVEIPMARLMQMPVSEEMLGHIGFCQKITAQIAKKRQLQYVAKQMRKEDPETLDAWRALLNFDKADVRREVAETHRIEALRDQLIAGDTDALTRFMAQFPQADSQQIRQLIRNAQFEKTKNKPPHAYRELFRVLRDVHKDSPAD
ncbi:ribosome biogenesis factor YjgA [Arenimonas sp.]|jgi:ribosome-associated protein|uniref:ribosome biogenesis factor YjgA n=1 Tax=Arenimonas sp. TaxID=1872635 RepID=UPI0037C1235E